MKYQKEKIMIKIGFDIDGCALQYTKRFAQVFKLFGGETDMSYPSEFNFFNVAKEEEKKSLYMTFAYMMQETLRPHEDFLSVIRYMILNRQQPMQFITARQADLSMNAAYKSLVKSVGYAGINEAYAKQFIKIHCVTGEDGSHGSKLPTIREYGLQYFVEDRRKNVLELAANGITVFMPRRSWNTLPEDTPNVIQYNDAAEIVKFLKGL